jgi:hypothetical protein
MHGAVALAARGLALLWAGFWLVFFVVESWVWHTPVNVMASWVALGLFFMLVAVVAWRWEVTGGLLLIVVGALAGLAYAIWAPEGLPPVSRLITTIVFSGPPILAGVLFLVHRRAPVRPASAA